MLRLVASVALAGIVASTTLAQTGPQQTNSMNNPNGPNNSFTPAVGGVQEQAILQILRNLGINPQERTVNGQKSYLLTLERDGWRYVIELYFMRNPQGQITGYTFVSPLGNQVNTVGLQTASMLNVLEGNLIASPAFFYYRPADQRLCLVLSLSLQNVNVNDQLVRGDLDLLTLRIRETQRFWAPVVTTQSQVVSQPVN